MFASARFRRAKEEIDGSRQSQNTWSICYTFDTIDGSVARVYKKQRSCFMVFV